MLISDWYIFHIVPVAFWDIFRIQLTSSEKNEKTEEKDFLLQSAN